MSDKDNLDPTKLTFNIFSYLVKLTTSIPTLIHGIIKTVKISYLMTEQHHKFTPESLVQKWTIEMKTASDTIKATIQLEVLSMIGQLEKRCRRRVRK